MKTDADPSFGNLTLAEKVLAPIATAVIVGWIMRATYENVELFSDWFALLSLPASLVILVLVALKFLGKLGFCPEKVFRIVLSTACLLPLLGFFVENVTQSPGNALTFVGSVALAYIGLTTFWRKRIPKAALDPLGALDRADEKRSEPEAPPPPEKASAAPPPPADDTEADDRTINP